MPIRKAFLVIAVAAALAAGCGDDDHYSDSTTSSYIEPTANAGVGTNPIMPSTHSVHGMGDDTLAPGGDPLIADQPTDTMKTGDPLDGGGDPLTGDQHGDLLTNASDPNGEQHPHLLTAHSHWLRGDVHNGYCSVYINGSQVAVINGNLGAGAGAAHVDSDISIHFQKGVNTAAFFYMPSSPKGWANLDVLESEHTPPIAPLASFDTRTIPNPTFSGEAQQDHQSFVFVAQ